METQSTSILSVKNSTFWLIAASQTPPPPPPSRRPRPRRGLHDRFAVSRRPLRGLTCRNFQAFKILRIRCLYQKLRLTSVQYSGKFLHVGYTLFPGEDNQDRRHHLTYNYTGHMINLSIAGITEQISSPTLTLPHPNTEYTLP